MKITTKIVKQGSGYFLRVPIALINSEVLKVNNTYEIEIKEIIV